MRLFIIRHADPDYPNNTITAAGHLEAQALAVRMTRLGLDRIYTSPLGRARDTARYTADALGIEPVVLPWTAELPWPRITQEVLGESTPWDLHGYTLRQWQKEPTTRNWPEFPPLSAAEYREGFATLGAGSDAFVAGLGYRREDAGGAAGGVYRVEAGNREKVAVFCHGGFGLTWLAHLLAVPLPVMWAGFFLPPSSVTTVLFDERGEGLAVPRCVGLGDVSHLYAAGLPVQPSGIKANVD
ncbi:phosphoglycerate kinase [Opitutaceae bacterium TAV5]|nr:phosphoglycerate kinase [Opitutaceae bacterium TAV5]